MIGGMVRAVRRNHALEHGTVSIMLARLGPDVRLAGRAVTDGFYIYGKVPTDVLTTSATEALARLKGGEAGLAVTPLCGTNIAVAGVLTGLASVMTMGRKKRFERLPTVFTAAMLGVVAAQPIGHVVQKYITTSADLDCAQITGVRSTARGFIHKVQTSFA
jgi:hypothetical protein